MNHLVEHQRQLNRSRTAASQADAQHCEITTRLVLTGAKNADSSLCVLGVGCGDDLQISAVASAYGSVHLMDVDAEALEAAARTFRDSVGTCQVSTTCRDLTGMFDAMVEASHKTSPNLRDQLIRQTESQPQWHPGWQFDCVTSTCLLSQLFDAARLAIGEPPWLHELLLALRRQHLKLMVELLNPHGLGLLIIDFVSSDTLPGMSTLAAAGFARAVRQAVEENNFFTGCNPLAIRHQLQTEAGLRQRVADVRISHPWRWSLGMKHLAVVAVSFAGTGVQSTVRQEKLDH